MFYALLHPRTVAEPRTRTRLTYLPLVIAMDEWASSGAERMALYHALNEKPGLPVIIQVKSKTETMSETGDWLSRSTIEGFTAERLTRVIGRDAALLTRLKTGRLETVISDSIHDAVTGVAAEQIARKYRKAWDASPEPTGHISLSAPSESATWMMDHRNPKMVAGRLSYVLQFTQHAIPNTRGYAWKTMEAALLTKENESVPESVRTVFNEAFLLAYLKDRDTDVKAAQESFERQYQRLKSNLIATS